MLYCISLCSRCLQSVIEGCGKAFNAHITQNLLDLIFQALNHTNRFVRETGYQLCASLVRLGRQQGYFYYDLFLKTDVNTHSRKKKKKSCCVNCRNFFSSFVLDDLSAVKLAAVVHVEDNAILKHGEQFADYLRKGLSDNWSQVRCLACLTCSYNNIIVHIFASCL